MKKYFALSIVLIGILSRSSAISSSKPVAVVTGTMNKFMTGEMVLFKAEDGKRVRIASYQKKKDLRFAFAVPLSEAGLYYLSDQSGWFYIRLYLKPGDQLELKVSYPGMYEIVKGSGENKMLHQWFKKVSSVTIPAFYTNDTCTYRSFFPKVKNLLPESAAFKKTISTTNAKFREILKLIIDIDIEYAALRFCLTPRTMFPPEPEFVDFIKLFKNKAKYCDGKLLALGESLDLIGLYVMANTVWGSGGERDIVAKSLLKKCEMLCNDTIKGAFVVSRFPAYKFYDEFVREVNPARQYLLTEAQQAAYDEKVKQFDTLLLAGKPAFNFQLPDNGGKKITMNDLKGKVVLVDVWATWCAPCREQIPHLKKLEEEFKGSDVAFVSVSVDKKEDKGKWTKFIEKEELGGIQLFAGDDKSFADFYKVSGIPRFMVFDKQGRIVNVDSARPSQPELKTLLEELVRR